MKKNVYSARDIQFMNSLNGAVVEKSPVNMTIVLYIIVFFVGACLVWANFAEIDEMTRGFGRVIPSYKIQVIQNLEGGIVEDILVNEGDAVKKGQVLVIIDDTGAGSSFEESNIRIVELRARSRRLNAEAAGKPFNVEENLESNYPSIVNEERKLYLANQKKLKSEVVVLKQRLRQRKISLEKATQSIRQLKLSKDMIQREMDLTEPLFKKNLVSELEYIQVKQKVVENQRELVAEINAVSSSKSQISEVQNQIQDLRAEHALAAQAELSKVVGELERLQSSRVALEDRVNRTHVRSPVNGTVKQLLINTEGGVVSPGMDILEIVPTDDKLLVEAKVKPSDIAFLYLGQDAVLKITAYDFAIYGSLEGKVDHISADTILDPAFQEEFYLVNIKTDKNYLGTEDNKKEIIVGMTVQADIITGKKTILQYIMKPILRAKYNAFREK
ncbi:MAG: HlyD family type I secretion periplasmic adaptor subunit [Desulfobacter sp.]|nr:MAG: HlyD family type I secretion periplasmic adaptor subunit [Desulfobacter sp.]